jgi:hypothetical protein
MRYSALFQSVAVHFGLVRLAEFDLGFPLAAALGASIC